jgi:DNA-binding winged helix-turn-helix (wHTH) protein
MDMKGVWVMVDGLERLWSRKPDLLGDNLEVFLSTMELFEEPSFCYKLTLPLELESRLMTASSVTTNRVDGGHKLVWEPKHLRLMMEKRISLMVGEKIQFDDIYNPAQLTDWLHGCAGSTPRGWAEYLRPIISAYWENLSNGIRRKLKKEEWITARKRLAPYLNFDEATGTVTIGKGNPRTLSPEVLAIFMYLYRNQDRVCTKREIYQNAYLPHATSGDPVTSQEILLPTDYEDLINTAIHRLRAVIEPVPKFPVFLTTVRNQGVRFNSIAFR